VLDPSVTISVCEAPMAGRTSVAPSRSEPDNVVLVPSFGMITVNDVISLPKSVLGASGAMPEIEVLVKGVTTVVGTRVGSAETSLEGIAVTSVVGIMVVTVSDPDTEVVVMLVVIVVTTNPLQ
jgi:hypothetical protein